ncbi:hypothetical protein BN971_00621, partial [Mycobacterium terramassiliense]
VSGDSTEARFWAVAEPLLADATVTRSTMMGLPCLRADGRFFASFDRRNAALIVKLPASRVNELMESGGAEPFAPSGRRFREWAAIGSGRPETWPALLREALAFVAAQQVSDS